MKKRYYFIIILVILIPILIVTSLIKDSNQNQLLKLKIMKSLHLYLIVVNQQLK